MAEGEVTRFEGRAMASPLVLTVLAPDRAVAARAWTEVVDEFSASDAAMSRFRADSDVTALNRASIAGDCRPVSARLRRAVTAADRAHRITGGRFDPRVVRLLDAWGYRGAALDDRAAPVEAPAAPRRVVAAACRAGIRVFDPVDLGGIGKGLALRWSATRLDRLGVSDFLLDAGGDIVARGHAPGGGPWRVGIEDPVAGDAPTAVLALADGAVATSSIRRLRWSDGQRVLHHLVDPSTRAPADGGLLAVSVAARDPAWAEVWSKALFVAGRTHIAAIARSRGLAAWWVIDDGALELTPGARQRTVWIAGEA